MTTPFWHDGIRFECQETGQCCLSRGEYGFVYISDKDRDRMAKHLRISPRAFVLRYTTKTDGYRHLKDPDEDCVFLNGKRCGIYQARPTQCRTWPFWPENLEDQREWNNEVAAFCPGVGKGRRRTKREILNILDEMRW